MIALAVLRIVTNVLMLLEFVLSVFQPTLWEATTRVHATPTLKFNGSTQLRTSALI